MSLSSPDYLNSSSIQREILVNDFLTQQGQQQKNALYESNILQNMSGFSSPGASTSSSNFLRSPSMLPTETANTAVNALFESEMQRLRSSQQLGGSESNNLLSNLLYNSSRPVRQTSLYTDVASSIIPSLLSGQGMIDSLFDKSIDSFPRKRPLSVKEQIVQISQREQQQTLFKKQKIHGMRTHEMLSNGIDLLSVSGKQAFGIEAHKAHQHSKKSIRSKMNDFPLPGTKHGGQKFCLKKNSFSSFKKRWNGIKTKQMRREIFIRNLYKNR